MHEDPWLDASTFQEDADSFDIIYSDALLALSKQLNQYHGMDLKSSQWEILIGPWLGTAISVFQNRSRITHQTEVPSSSSLSVTVPLDFESFMGQVRDSAWNSSIFPALSGKAPGINEVVFVPQVPRRRKYSGAVKQKALKLSRTLNTKYLVESTYFPKLTDLRMAAKLRCLPPIATQTETSSVFEPSKLLDTRWRLSDSTLVNHQFQGYHLSRFLRSSIPQAYLEDFNRLLGSVISQKGHMKEGYFTSNAFWYDEWFKLAVALRREGAKFVIGQHGGVYGTARVSNSEKFQVSVSDLFISWGWTDALVEGSVSATGHFGKGRLGLAPSRRGGLCVVQTNVPQFSHHQFSAPTGEEAWRIYSEHSLGMISLLKPDVQRKTTVRLKGADFGQDQIAFWNGGPSGISLDLGKGSIKRRLNRSRLAIVTYNGTTHLDTLAANFPTILLWDDAFWKLRESAAGIHNDLEKAKILFYDQKEAADHINSVWGNVPSWWGSPAVQEAIQGFNQRFAAPTPNNKEFISKLSQILKH